MATIEAANILYPLISVGGMAMVFGAVLGFAKKKFAVKVNPLIEQIQEVLPGANCGGCGFAGCAAFAGGVANGVATYKDCPVGGASVAAQIADILGVDVSESNRKTAFVKCAGSCSISKHNYEYVGIESCIAATMLATGGSKTCSYGCLGLSSCKQVCPFNAIDMVDGVAVINEDKCTSCGKCVVTCPKQLIELVPAASKVRVVCNSNDKGKDVRAYCSVGCIGCGICKKTCQYEAISVDKALAQIDYEKCTQCGDCVAKCPMKTISKP